MTTRMGIAVLALVGLLLATYLTLYKFGVIGEITCTVGSCETVQTSRWALFLGFPVALWGAGAYAGLLVLALLGVQPRFERARAISWALVALSGWSVLFSGWLTYLELFVIHAICIWCVTSAVLMLVIFAASLLDLRLARSG